MEGLTAQQTILVEQITRLYSNFKKDSKARKTLAYATKWLQRVQDIRRSFMETHSRIMNLITGENDLEHAYFVSQCYNVFEEISLNFETDLEKLQSDQKAQATPTSKLNSDPSLRPSEELDVRLPRIELPRFSGNYSEWTSFKDLFTSLIHNKSSLSCVQKLHYLKCSLSGDAEQLLRHYSTTEANYEVAWATLMKRYDNKQVLLNTQFKRLLTVSNADESASSIKMLMDKTTEIIQAIESLKVENLWEAILIHLTTQRLPSETRQIWELQRTSEPEKSSFHHLKEFLHQRFRALEAAGTERSKPLRVSQNVHIAQSESFSHCILCRDRHHVRQCPTFLRYDHTEKFNVVKKNGLCLNCLVKGHLVGNCPSKSRCLKCKRAHHTLLHKYDSNSHVQQPKTSFLQTQNRPSTSTAFHSQPSTSTQHTLNHQSLNAPSFEPRPLTSLSANMDIKSIKANNRKEVLLATALVTIEATNGPVVLRALLDQGSQTSLITESATQRLGLKRTSTNITISGIGKTEELTPSGVLKCRLLLNSNEHLNIEALILNKLTNIIPSQVVPTSIWRQLENLEMADPYFDQPSKIDLILGADTYAQLILDQIRKLPSGPIIQLTKLGWIISGKINIEGVHTVQTLKIEINEDMEISNQLKRFWEIEELENSKMWTQEETECEEHYKRNVVRKPDGRYQVRLPFKSEEHKNLLGHSKQGATASLLSLERRFSKNNDLRTEYSACIQDYIDLGHMTESLSIEEGQTGTQAFLPHHAVYKESTTTKLRVVFDASRKTSTGIALNDTLMTGPTIQDTMTLLVIRWRLYQFAIVADIAKMYRQVDVHPEDASYQKIVWRQHPNHPIKEYSLNTVTFGTTSAPFLAIRTLHQLAKEEVKVFPKASMALLNEFYVDDLLSGEHSVEECINKGNELIELLRSGGFTLRKWISNEKQILQGLKTKEIEMQGKLNLDAESGHKSLGILWYPSNDYFTYKVKSETLQESYTKRMVLSQIARLYDPLGWLAPILILAKILLQTLWLHGQDWDEPLSDATNTEWTTFQMQLNEIEKIKIPRWVAYKPETNIEIHGFCDASQRAYASVLYLVTRSQAGTSAYLIMAKTKVAPTKPTTIPRLELCGAVLLARVLKEVKRSLKSDKIPTWLWTDSEIVLAWIKGHPTRWKSFVANRTSYIIESTGGMSWRYVPSKENPADLASRGIKPQDLVNNELWWHGPNWLKKCPDAWPKTKEVQVIDLERKIQKTVSVGLVVRILLDELVEKYSSLHKLIRITSYCFRFLRLKTKQGKNEPYLTTIELKHSFDFWIKYAQRKEFSHEICCLQNGKPIDKKSKLLNLNPFIDGHGILRVGGRLHNARIHFDEKHPIIIPKNGKFTQLLLHQTHKATLHGQTQLMLNTLRKRFWMIDGRNGIKHFIHRCIRCFRTKAKGSTQLMGSLPTARVNISRPFTHTGIDFCGPFDIKDRRGRGCKISKGYVAIFICLTTKAIHIEVVSDLSTQAFLAAVRRFMGRRGFSTHFFSDCGTNFVGANAVLKKIEEINRYAAKIFTNDGVQWHFNPPASPHFGGLWEAGVKSIKSHLRRIVGSTPLTYEELSTVLIRIEACLNSRPLCPLTDDPSDTTALTPAHFLIGDTMLAPPELDLFDTNINRLDRWQLTQKLTQDFWKRWQREYLNRLQRRPKWLNKETNIKIGDLCLLKDDKLPSYRWALARITEIHPGKDSLVRVVTVQSRGKLYKRAISNIALLPTQEITN